MDKWSEHIDNKYGGCDMPFDERFINNLSAEEQEQIIKSTFSELIAPAIEKIIPTLAEAVENILPIVKSLIESVNDFNKQFIEAYQTCPNKRVLYLALHAKKERVRKKNDRRVWEYYLKNK